MNNRRFGDMGEEIAVKYLEDKGYKIIARNVHYSRFCELDIVAKDRNMYVFVEVKTRKNADYGTPFEAVTKTKLNNIVKGAMHYSGENKIKNFRIDVIGITLYPDLHIEHLTNIYT